MHSPESRTSRSQRCSRKPPLVSPLSLIMAGALTGCTTLPDIPSQNVTQLGGGIQTPAAVPTATKDTGVDSKPQPILFKGNDRVVNLPPARPAIALKGEAVSLNFEQAPITDVLHGVLGDLLKLDYSIDAPVKGEVTLRTRGPIPRDQLLPVLESLLQANGAAMTRDESGIIHVAPMEAVRGVNAPLNRPGLTQPGMNTVVVPLRYIGAAEMSEILKPIAPPESFIRVDTLRNLIVLSGTANQIGAWNEIITTFDVDMLQGMSVGIFPLEHASVKEADAAIQLLMGSGGDGKGATPLGGVVRVLPIERLNSLLVVTPRAHYLEQIQEWIGRLDRPPENDFEPQLFVYPVQNGTATHLAQLLNGLFSGMLDSEQAGPGRTAQGSGIAPGLGSTTITSASGTNSLNGTSNPSAQGTLGTASTTTGGLSSGMTGSMTSSPTSGTRTGGVTSSLGRSTTSMGQANTQTVAQISLAPQVRIVADEENNALIIHAPRKDYRKIENALRQLDIAPTQVLIEASILEVSLTDDLKYGLEWHLENALGSGWRSASQLNFNASGGIAASQPGFGFTVTNPAGAVRAVLNTLAEKSLVKVISSPSIMVLDNQTASIHVGDQQPVRSSETITEGGNVSTSIQYKDTGVMLAVTPSVNAGGMVTMTIKQSVTDVGLVDSATGQRTFLQREVGSRVAVRSGETVVIGGLIRDNSSQGKNGIPLLMDIPAVGNLFSTTTDNNTRTELLVMMTPRVLSNDQDLRDISQEMKQRLVGLKLLSKDGNQSN